MINDFKIPFEIAFHIVRYGNKSLYNMSELEFQEERDNIKGIFEKIDIRKMFINPDIEDFDAKQVPFVCHTFCRDILWHHMNPDMFAIFWLLSLDNIYVPTDIYTNQI